MKPPVDFQDYKKLCLKINQGENAAALTFEKVQTAKAGTLFFKTAKLGSLRVLRQFGRPHTSVQ